MKILVSCVPFDHGRSGISVYIRHTVAALAAAGTGFAETIVHGFHGQTIQTIIRHVPLSDPNDPFHDTYKKNTGQIHCVNRLFKFFSAFCDKGGVICTEWHVVS